MVTHAICQNLRISTQFNRILCFISTSATMARQRHKPLSVKQGRRPRKVLYMDENSENDPFPVQQSRTQSQGQGEGFTPLSSTEWPHARGRPALENITSKLTNPRVIKDAWKDNVTTDKSKKNLRTGTVQKKKHNKFGLNQDQMSQSLENLDEIHYEILSEGDKRFGQVVMTAKSRKLREKEGIILLEGHRLISDAILAGAHIESLFFTKLEHLANIPLNETDAALYKVRYQHMKIWSDVDTPPGIMAICQMPRPGSLEVTEEGHYPIALVCDNIRDPGNMGTLLRIAAAAGCHKVLATTGCVDIWSPKVLRAGAGCHFRTHVINNLGWQILSSYLQEDTQVFLADCNSTDPSVPLQLPSAAVAQRIAEDAGETYTVVDEETGEALDIDESYLDEETVQLYKDMPLAMCHYFEADIDTSKPTVLVIGGETEGLSAAANKLAFQKNGERLVIPMNEGVNSLNAAVAASVILFDIKKKYMQNKC